MAGVGCCVTPPWLFKVCMDGVVREMNIRVLGKGLKLLLVNSGRLKIKPAVIYREYCTRGRLRGVCERKSRLNIGKCKVMRCSMYVNVS